MGVEGGIRQGSFPPGQADIGRYRTLTADQAAYDAPADLLRPVSVLWGNEARASPSPITHR